MVGKKQRFRTAILVLILAVAIVGGVFAISYFKGGVTFPWQIATAEQEQEQAVTEPAKEEPKLVVKEKQEAEEKKEEPKEEQKEEPKEEEKTEDEAVVQTGCQLDYYGSLHVEDGKLYDEVRNEVRLTGISTNNLSWYPDFASADSIKFLKSNLGINVIRLALFTSDYDGYCVAGADKQQELKKIIDEAVQAATDNEMYVILDWHTLNDANPNEYKSEAIQFFGEMVRKYESNDNVIYEICNEPNDDTTWEDIKAYAKEVIPVIRRVNRTALILVGTPEGCTDLDSALADPLDSDAFGTNIMYTYHFNARTQKSSDRNTLSNALEDGLPVFISQFSYYSADGVGDLDKHEAARWDDLLDEYNLSSCIWNLSNSDEGSALINHSCDKNYDFNYDDLSEQGKHFFDKLSENRKKAEIPEKDEIKDSKEIKRR
ncbi:MAG: glycoside hydrolase family 5 protein [Pseudobutyrivibrio sp.]|nr:glycoside hydrolase family 5 protein [Pseudobutyrivibrio sp.]